ncbi:MAG: hypothetical protein ABI621_04700 [Chloroflexota bacterium]
MSGNQSYEVLINPHPLYWVRDREQILIVDEQSQEIYALQHVEAAVWTWLALAYSYAKIVELSTAMLGVPSAEAEQRLQVIFQNWQNTGILAIEAR